MDPAPAPRSAVSRGHRNLCRGEIPNRIRPLQGLLNLPTFGLARSRRQGQGIARRDLGGRGTRHDRRQHEGGSWTIGRADGAARLVVRSAASASELMVKASRMHLTDRLRKRDGEAAVARSAATRRSSARPAASSTRGCRAGKAHRPETFTREQAVACDRHLVGSAAPPATRNSGGLDRRIGIDLCRSQGLILNRFRADSRSLLLGGRCCDWCLGAGAPRPTPASRIPACRRGNVEHGRIAPVIRSAQNRLPGP